MRGRPAATETFERVSKSVPAARRFLAGFLEEHGRAALGWSAEQLVSELATNAVLHAGGREFTVTLELAPDGSLRVEVFDSSRRAPRLRHYSTDSCTGRGVALVAGLSRAWGVEPRTGGKVVWCEIGPDGGSDDDEDADLHALLPFSLDGLLPAPDRRRRDRAAVRVA